MIGVDRLKFHVIIVTNCYEIVTHHRDMRNVFVTRKELF